jgi:hypothetical protein
MYLFPVVSGAPDSPEKNGGAKDSNGEESTEKEVMSREEGGEGDTDESAWSMWNEEVDDERNENEKMNEDSKEHSEGKEVRVASDEQTTSAIEQPLMVSMDDVPAFSGFFSNSI